MNRRNFLKGCLAASVAPAFIKSESLMALYVPKAELIRVGDFVFDHINKNIIYRPQFYNAMQTFALKDMCSATKIAWRDNEVLSNQPFPLKAYTPEILDVTSGYRINQETIENVSGGTLVLSNGDTYTSFLAPNANDRFDE